MMGMTPKQAKLFFFLKEFIDAHGFPPSFAEMCDALGLKSKNSIFEYLRKLEDRGLIRRRSNCARSLEIVNPTAEMAFFETLPSGIRHIIRTIAIRERRTNESVMREWIRERAESFRTPYVEQLSA